MAGIDIRHSNQKMMNDDVYSTKEQNKKKSLAQIKIAHSILKSL